MIKKILIMTSIFANSNIFSIQETPNKNMFPLKVKHKIVREIAKATSLDDQYKLLQKQLKECNKPFNSGLCAYILSIIETTSPEAAKTFIDAMHTIGNKKWFQEKTNTFFKYVLLDSENYNKLESELAEDCKNNTYECQQIKKALTLILAGGNSLKRKQRQYALYLESLTRNK